MLESFFNGVSGLETSIFAKKLPQQICFPVNFARFLRTVVEYLQIAASEIVSYQVYTLLSEEGRVQKLFEDNPECFDKIFVLV